MTEPVTSDCGGRVSLLACLHVKLYCGGGGGGGGGGGRRAGG